MAKIKVSCFFVGRTCIIRYWVSTFT